ERDTVPVPQPSAERCSEECEADSQCPWGQRCTHTSCGRVCVDTPGGRGGECPMPVGISKTCLDLCSLDEECPWGHKCCSNGCGHHGHPGPQPSLPPVPWSPCRVGDVATSSSFPPAGAVQKPPLPRPALPGTWN
uniref:WAP domain-containing protein n=1 Tax=Catharus ustulatus TaxID=91951 RepID=A0A8C3U354_CATUS